MSARSPGVSVNGDTIWLTSAEAIHRIVDRVAAQNLPVLCLFQAVAAGDVALAKIEDPTAMWPTRILRHYRKPVIVLLGDDPEPGAPSLGPAGWSCARKLRDWARAVIIHGARGEPEHYREALRGARSTGRCALVETSSSHAAEWAEFMACARTLLIVPPPGVVHPALPNRGDMH